MDSWVSCRQDRESCPWLIAERELKNSAWLPGEFWNSQITYFEIVELEGDGVLSPLIRL
jgi:hypothetical protein